MRDRKLCENCLSYTHFATGCKSPRACSVEQCSISRKHLGSLHDALLASFRRRQDENRDQGAAVGSSSNLTQPQRDNAVLENCVSFQVEDLMETMRGRKRRKLEVSLHAESLLCG